MAEKMALLVQKCLGDFFWQNPSSAILRLKKIPMTNKLEGVKALLVGPLKKKIFFCGLP